MYISYTLDFLFFTILSMYGCEIENCTIFYARNASFRNQQFKTKAESTLLLYSEILFFFISFWNNNLLFKF